MEVVIFGAGQIGYEAYRVCENEGITVKYFIDNNNSIHGNIQKYTNVKIISIEDYIEQKMKYHIVVAAQYKYQSEIEDQLKSLGIDNYSIFDLTKILKYGRLTSYSAPEDIEDVILYHLFKEEDDIFYIDVGCNDPFISSVTKLLYDCKSAHGINIDPQKYLIDTFVQERPRDISIFTALGKEDGKMLIHLQGSGSTLINDHSIIEKSNTEEVPITTLKSICDKYIAESQTISFLKIDVEGAERDVLLGADFKKYRPEIICIEAVIPRTKTLCHDKWEGILLDNDYEYIFSYGDNRYYSSVETICKFKKKIGDITNLYRIYNIFHASLFYTYSG